MASSTMQAVTHGRLRDVSCAQNTDKMMADGVRSGSMMPSCRPNQDNARFTTQSIPLNRRRASVLLALTGRKAAVVTQDRPAAFLL